jgi:Zn-dependent oligopeptidase
MLLSLKFEEVEDFSTYHEELRLFKVTDAITNNLVGYFYTDLHPRDGKYGHAAVFGIRVIFALSNFIHSDKIIEEFLLNSKVVLKVIKYQYA